MSFLARIVRFLFWLLIVSWSVALLRRLVGWMLRKATTPEQGHEDADGAGAEQGSAQGGLAARRLVRDPICGMHVAEVLAVPLREGGELVHFCSSTCRDTYVSGSQQRMAANG